MLLFNSNLVKIAREEADDNTEFTSFSDSVPTLKRIQRIVKTQKYLQKPFGILNKTIEVPVSHNKLYNIL